MDHTLFTQELKQTIADFNKEIRVSACSFELRLPDAGSTLAVISTLILAGFAQEGALEARLCKDCGAYHARRVRR